MRIENQKRAEMCLLGKKGPNLILNSLSYATTIETFRRSNRNKALTGHFLNRKMRMRNTLARLYRDFSVTVVRHAIVTPKVILTGVPFSNVSNYHFFRVLRYFERFPLTGDKPPNPPLYGSVGPISCSPGFAADAFFPLRYFFARAAVCFRS